jgi:hypothetical protein
VRGINRQRRVSAPALAHHSAEPQDETNRDWQSCQPASTSTSVAAMGNHAAIEALSHVGDRFELKMPSRVAGGMCSMC